MIAIGGVIGAGLFVGSGVVIQSAGPAAIISFLITGILVILVMRMLGEMAVALPAVGSFYEYSRLAWGERVAWGELAGFLTGSATALAALGAAKLHASRKTLTTRKT